MAKVTARSLIFNSPNSHDQNRDVRTDAWLTAKLIYALKLPYKRRAEIYQFAEQLNHAKPYIADFREFFPTFPIYVTVREKLALRENAGLAKLFPLNKAMSQAFVRQFMQMVEQEQHDIGQRASAMLMAWPPRTPVAIHNLPVPRENPGVGLFITDGKKLRLTVEPLEQLVATVRMHLPEDF